MAQGRQYTLYGYGQVDFSASSRKGSTSGFDQRRINFIGEFFPAEQMRVLTDIEYEGGTNIDAGNSSYSGAVKISRVWLEYTVMPELKIRAGKMLTAFGLYNLIHDASASYFPLEAPIMYSMFSFSPNLKPQRLYSKYHIGIELLGTFDLDDTGSQLEYSVGIGNGRGAKADGTDINNGRSFYSRMIYRPSILSGLQIGSSFYYDRNYEGLGGIQNDLEYTYAFDLQYENNSFQFQTEGLITNYKTIDNTRQSTGVWYAQLVYNMFDVLSPYINYSAILFDIKNSEHGFSRTNLGINWSVSPYLYLKSEIQFHDAEEVLGDESFNVYKISAAFAF